MESEKNVADLIRSLGNEDFRNHENLIEHTENSHPSEKMKNDDVDDSEHTLNENDDQIDSVQQKPYHLRKIIPRKTEGNTECATRDRMENDEYFCSRTSIAQSNEADENDRTFECGSCSKRYQRRLSLTEHIRKCHSKNIFKIKEKYIKCNSCHRKYRYRRGVLEHIRRHHPKQVTPKSKQALQKNYECVVCHRRYSYRRGLHEHIRNFHPAIAPQKIRNFECDMCNKKYSYLRGLREHIKKQHITTVKPTIPPIMKICEFCNKEYRFSHALHEHVKREHPAAIVRYTNMENIFICFLCNTSYGHRSGIISHIQKHHPTTISTENDSERTFVCNSCPKKYRLKGSLTLHVRREHNENLLTCAFCGKILLSRENLTHHIQKHHCVVKKRKNTENRLKQGIRVCPLCMLSYVRKSDILYHLHNTHGIQVTEEFFEYIDEQSFFNWKEQVEHCTRSKYVLYNKYKSDSEIVVNFVCHRSGWYQTKGKGIRNIRRIGTKKINSYCPAEIQLRICNERNSYFVHFTSTHVGHDTKELRELRYLKLPKSERECLAKLLPVDVFTSSNEDVAWHKLNDNVNCVSASNDELSVISTDDVYDTEEFEILTFEEYSDETCVESWINDNRNDILYYKGKNQDDPAFPKLQTLDFVLIIANEYQMEMLRNFGSKIIAIDSTHEPNIYDFELSIITVFDNLMQEFPCVFMFSNRRDEYVYRILVRKIKEKIGQIESTVFISDMNENCRNSWRIIMPLPQISLYCSWHVSQEWNKNLNKIAIPEKRQGMKIILDALKTELNPYRFHELLENFVDDVDPDTREFRNYFEKHFQGDVSAWAYCYRKYARVNTITQAENFFAYAKRSHIDNRTALDLRGALDVLSERLKNLYSELIKIEVVAKLVPKNKVLRKKHIEAVKNIDKIKSINKLTDDKWYVPSFSDENNVHDVELVVTVCECELRCAMCNACLHQFICSCPENCIEYNMCEHIHLVCLLENESKHKTTDDILEDAENLIEVVEEQGTLIF